MHHQMHLAKQLVNYRKPSETTVIVFQALLFCRQTTNPFVYLIKRTL